MKRSVMTILCSVCLLAAFYFPVAAVSPNEEPLQHCGHTHDREAGRGTVFAPVDDSFTDEEMAALATAACDAIQAFNAANPEIVRERHNSALTEAAADTDGISVPYPVRTVTVHRENAHGCGTVFWFADGALTDDEAAAIAATAGDAIQAFNAANPEIVKERFNSALTEAADTDAGLQPSGSTAAVDISLPEGPAVLYGAHVKGSLLGTLKNCVNHHCKLLTGNIYACQYDLYNVFGCNVAGHEGDCIILEYLSTQVGVFAH